MIDEILRDPAAQQIESAIEQNLYAWLAHHARIPGARLRDEADLTWFQTGAPSPLLNGVITTHLGPDRANARIKEVVSAFRQGRVPFAWWTGPSSTPRDLGIRLRRAGFRYLGDAPGMALDFGDLDLSESATSSVEIRRVREKDVSTWRDIFAAAFRASRGEADAWSQVHTSLGLGPHQPLRHFVALDAGHGVAIASLFLSTGVAGVYHVGTVPEARGRGLGQAITEAVLRDARKEGYEVAILQSSRMGLPLYTKFGFREYCRLGVYTWDGEGRRRRATRA